MTKLPKKMVFEEFVEGPRNTPELRRAQDLKGLSLEELAEATSKDSSFTICAMAESCGPLGSINNDSNYFLHGGKLYEIVLGRQNSPGIHIKAALMFEKALKWGMAEEHFQKAIDDGDKSCGVYLSLAGMQIESGSYDTALKSLDEAWMMATPDDKNLILIRRGRALTFASRFDEAVDAFKQILEQDPNDAVAYRLMGRAYVLGGDINEGTHSFHKAIKLNLYFELTSRAFLGDVYSLDGSSENAKEMYEQTINHTKTNWNKHGGVYLAAIRAQRGLEALGQKTDIDYAKESVERGQLTIKQVKGVVPLRPAK